MAAETKQLLLQQGMAMLLRQGYNDLGVAALLSATDTPKGSFYHHFKSKEDFALQAIDLYMQEVHAGLDNFLNDASKRTTELNGGFNVRLFKGLSLNAGAGYNWIQDQVYLPKGSQNAVDVLLRRRALLTGFEYFTHFGVSYTFGSIFNNVVNPRF